MEPSTNDILRDRGLALQAIACLDTAIWDVFGKALGLPLHRLWGIGHRFAADERHRRLLPPRPATRLADVDGGLRRSGFGGVKFKVGGRTPGRGRRAGARRTRGRSARTSRSWSTPTRATSAPQAVEFGRLVADLDIRWFEEPCRWTNDRRWMRDVRYQTGIPVCAGQSETTLQRDPRPHRRGRHRRLQLRRVVGRRPDHLAQGRRPVPPPSASSSATTRSRRSRRTCWRASPTTRSWSASTRSATRSSGACPTSRRDPRRPATPARTPRLRHRARLGLRRRAHGRPARHRSPDASGSRPGAERPGSRPGDPGRMPSLRGPLPAVGRRPCWPWRRGRTPIRRDRGAQEQPARHVNDAELEQDADR